MATATGEAAAEPWVHRQMPLEPPERQARARRFLVRIAPALAALCAVPGPRQSHELLVGLQCGRPRDVHPRTLRRRRNLATAHGADASVPLVRLQQAISA